MSEEEHKAEENLTVGKATLCEGREIKQDADDDKREDGEAVHQSEYEEYCRTPTSEEHKIPRAQSCPPAPRKPPVVQEQVSFLHKRKLFEFNDNIIVKDEEVVESLFGSSSSSSVEISRVSSSWPRKRRCKSR